MKVVCCVCQKLIGIKDTGNPKEDELISHSYCQDCFEKEREKFKKEKESLVDDNQKRLSELLKPV